MEDKKGITIICILSIILVISLFMGIIKDKKINSENQKEYNEWVSSKEDKEKSDSIENKKEEDSKEQTTVSNFYEKIKNKEDVRILILGDGIALSQGRNSNNGIWTEGVKWLINEKYGSNVELVSLAKERTTTAEGNQIVTNNDVSNFDLIVICYGYNDNSSNENIDNFKESYTNIINQIKTKSPNGIIIPILPNYLNKDNQYRNSIINIAQTYQLTCADMQQKFANCGLAQSKLANGNIPNDLGYQYYTETIGEVIEQGVNS